MKKKKKSNLPNIVEFKDKKNNCSDLYHVMIKFSLHETKGLIKGRGKVASFQTKLLIQKS